MPTSSERRTDLGAVTFDYEVSAVFTLPVADLDYVIELAQCHYDLTCKRAGRPGPEGFLHGMKNRAEVFEESAVAEGRLTGRQVNIILKILEMPNNRPDLVELFVQLFRKIADEYTRLIGPILPGSL